MSRNVGTPEYWNSRVKSHNNLQDMIFKDIRRDEFWERVDSQIRLWEDKKTIDVCCGYGRFTLDSGVDFSEEMIKLARGKFPDKNFTNADIKVFKPDKVDVIYEVNSLHSLGWTPLQFYEHFKGRANIIACLECDIFTIFQDYGV